MPLYDVILALDKNHLNDSRVRGILHFYQEKSEGFGGKIEVFDTFSEFNHYMTHSVRLRRRLVVFEEINFQEYVRLAGQTMENFGDGFLLLADHYKPNKREETLLLDIWQRTQGTTWELAARQLHRLMLLFSKHEVLLHKMDELFMVSQKLVSEKETKVLLEAMRDAAMAITAADAGTIYTIVEKESSQWAAYSVGEPTQDYWIQFETAKNNSIHLDLKRIQVPINTKSIIGSSIKNGRPILIQDTEQIDSNAGYIYDRSFDEKTGYKTVSLLTVPFKNREGKVLGAIQLINKLQDGAMKPFDKEDVKMVASLAGQAAVALENSHLYGAMNHLLKDYQELIQKEARSPQTNGDKASNPLQDAVIYSPTTIIILDAGWRCLYLNDRFECLTGYQVATSIGEPLACFEGLRMGETLYGQIKDEIEATGKWIGEFKGHHKSGRVFWASASVAAVYERVEDALRIKYYIAVLEDISKLKEAKIALETKNKSLQETLIKLSNSQAQLVQHEKAAALGQLAAGMAHEMNTPLGYVASNVRTMSHYIKTLLNDIGTSQNLVKERGHLWQEIMAEEPELTRETTEGIEKISTIIRALRMISGIDQWEKEGAIDIRESIMATLVLLEHELKQIGTCHCDLEEGVSIYGNATDFNQSIFALLRNSVDAIKEKNIPDGKIQITGKRLENIYQLNIRDNGIGISKENLRKVFDPFFTTKPIGVGTGLGLSSAKAAFEKIGGKLVVESVLDQYTQVTITFDLKIKFTNQF